MRLDGFSLFGGLHRTTGLGVVAAALAMTALPEEAFAQNRSGWGPRANSGTVQTQGTGGSNRGGSVAASPSSPSSSASPSQPRPGGWQSGGARSSRAVQAPRSDGAGWRSGSGAVQTPRSSSGWSGSAAVPPPPSSGRRGGSGWRGAGSAQPQDNGHNGWRSSRSGTAATPTLPDNPGATITPARPITGRWSSQTTPSQDQQQAGRFNQRPDRRHDDLTSDGRRGDGRHRDDSHNNWDNRRDGHHRSDNHRNWGSRGGTWSSNRDWRDYGGSYGYSSNPYHWDRNWRDNSRYDWRHHRSRHHHVYRLGRYYSPYRDWGYSRLYIGIFLDSPFYSSRYRIDDPWRYRLPPAYGPYRWIRYYDDALLVNVYTGEVIDVIYEFFW